MRHLFLLILILCSISAVSTGQILKGKITNQSGEPVQYATVYIQQLRQGTTTNSKGDYEIKIPEGKYQVTFQSLGFSPVISEIDFSGQKSIVRNVILQMQYYQIPEVRISATGEDPAYSVMRKAIGMAPYYLNNVSYYKAEVYLKGNLLINKIPKLLQKSLKMEQNNRGTSVSAGRKQTGKERTLKAGDSFLMESFNEIEFTAPEKYFQKVISVNSTFPEQGNTISPMSFIQASFYQPVLAEIAISPLSPQAFSYYTFKFLGSTPEANFTINKIQVIPKRKSQQVFDGTIYIIEDLWCLQSVDLTNENLLGKIRIQQLYIPVKDDIWLPMSHTFEINIGIMGLKADAGYGASVKYLEVKPNLVLQRPIEISTDYTGKTQIVVKNPESEPSKGKKQIEKILEKDELSNRDMAKLSRLMDKESEKSRPDSIRKNLEIKDNTIHVVEKDANKKDSTYWAEIRPIPLSDIDIRAIRTRDSIKLSSRSDDMSSDTTAATSKEIKNKFLRTLKQIGFGHTWSDTIGLSFTNGGLINLKNFSFNPVDGFIYGVNFRISKSWKEARLFSVSPDFRYAFSREQLMCRVNANYRFDGLKQKQIFIRTGITSKDISNGGSINLLLNSEASLFLKKNYLKLYDTRYITLGYRSEIINGLYLEFNTDFEKRTVLQNNSNFSFFRTSDIYSDNTPDNLYLNTLSNPFNALRNQRHADFVTKVTYTPYQRYRIRDGNKTARGSDWPTFNLTWEHGINEFSDLADKIKQFDMFRFEASKSKSIGAFSEFSWRIRAGGFLDNRTLPYIDFFHFNSQPIIYLIDNYQDAFMLPAYYSLSTPELFGELHVKYTTPYLLIKLLPGISNTLMRENLSFSYLGSRFHKNYSEFGYSISEIFLVAEIGVWVGFEDIKYKSVGAKLIFPFN
jgi:hypothetical protein